MDRNTVRPADAAALVLIRGACRNAEVFLGRRHRAMRFMPGYYVFPGGRVHAADRRPSGFAEDMAPPPEGIDQATRRRLVVFARTALRETFEESGLLLSAPESGPGRRQTTAAPLEPGIWQAFARAGLAPGFGRLKLVARALTPRVSPIRFHTRFFRADGTALRGQVKGDGELEDLGWVPVGEAGTLPISEVTLLVLNEALAHGPAAAPTWRPAMLFSWIGAAEQPRSRAAPGRPKSLT